MSAVRFALAAFACLALAGAAAASGDCNNAVCDVAPVELNCDCNYVNQLYTPSDSCCPEYRCAPPPAEDAVNCTNINPIPTCDCGFMPEVVELPDESVGRCCPEYRCVRNVSVPLCDCATCPEPPPCDCPGYEPVPSYHPTYRNGDCCPKKYKCRLTNRTISENFVANNCTTPEEFFLNNQTGCRGDCRFEVHVVEPASGKNDQCCDVLSCRPLRRPKCCTEDEVNACPPVNASCACPQLTRVVVQQADPLEGRCCPVTDCVDLGTGSPPDCSLYEPLCLDSCKEPVITKAANPLKGRCCDIKKCKKIKGCKNKAPSAGRRRRRRRN